MRGNILGLALCATTLAATADAAVISFDGSTSGDKLYLEKFDPSLGTLYGALLYFSGFAESGMSSTDADSLTATAFISFVGNGIDASDDNTVTVECEIEVYCEVRAEASVNGNLYFFELGLAPFIGPGMLEFDTFFSDLGALNARISYDYTPSAVPLPAAGGMLLAGLGGLAALRRRRAT